MKTGLRSAEYHAALLLIRKAQIQKKTESVHPQGNREKYGFCLWKNKRQRASYGCDLLRAQRNGAITLITTGIFVKITNQLTDCIFTTIFTIGG